MGLAGHTTIILYSGLTILPVYCTVLYYTVVPMAEATATRRATYSRHTGTTTTSTSPDPPTFLPTTQVHIPPPPPLSSYNSQYTFYQQLKERKKKITGFIITWKKYINMT